MFKIMGGCDKQGFPMKQGVLTQGRVRILMHRGLFFLSSPESWSLRDPHGFWSIAMVAGF